MPAPRKNLLLPASAALLLLGVVSHAQLPAPPATTEDALHQMLSQAGIVFTGQVTAVRHIGSANGSTGLIEIDFAVDDAILGVAPNSTYTLREWAGLAPNGASNFTPGRRYLIFLHAPGSSGLTSPVGGPDGAIPIVPGNPAASPTTPDTLGLAAQTAAAQIPQTTAAIPPSSLRSPAHTTFRIGPSDEPASPAASILASSTLASSTIDLRWVATHVLTPLAYAPEPESADAHPLLTPRPVAELRGSAISSLADGLDLAFSPAPQPTTSANYADLLSKLRTWQGQDRAPR